MTQTLTQLIASVQAQLIDSGTRFTTATCTAAIRAAFSTLNKRMPIYAADVIDAVTSQYDYEIEDTTAIEILNILQSDPSGGQYDLPLEYDDYTEDNRLWFRLRQPLSTSLTIITRYTKFHTVNGLDSETQSTLTADQDQVLINGSCAYAMAIRAPSRIETINLQSAVSKTYNELKRFFEVEFEKGLQFYSRQKPPPDPMRTTAWNDSYHNYP